MTRRKWIGKMPSPRSLDAWRLNSIHGMLARNKSLLSELSNLHVHSEEYDTVDMFKVSDKVRQLSFELTCALHNDINRLKDLIEERKLETLRRKEKKDECT